MSNDSLLNSRPFLKFITWLCFGFAVCLIGITNVFALTNDNRLEFYDNNGSSLSLQTTSFIEQTGESNATFTTTANSYGGAVMITLDQPLVSGYIYTIFLNVGAANMGGATRLSSKNCIGLSDGKSGAINNYINCDITPRYSDYTNSTGDKTRGLYFTFVAKRNGIYLLLPYTSQYTCSNCYQYSYGYELNTVGDSNSLSETEVNNIINSQTTIIQNQISSLESGISSNIQDMTDSINDNINDNMQTCVEASNLSFTTFQDKAIDSSNGEMINANGWLATDFIRVYQDTTYTHSGFSSNMIALYDENKNYISYLRQSSYTPTSNVYYIRMNSTINNYNGVISHTGYCLNKLDEAENTRKGILGKIGDIFNGIFDTSGPDTSQYGNVAGWLPPGPIDSILTLPLTLLNSLTTGLGSTCTPLSVPIPFLDTNFQLPCLNTLFSQINGVSTLYSWFGPIAAALILYYYLKSLYKWIDKKLSLQEDHDWGGV